MKSLISDAELLNVQVSDALQDVENSLKSLATSPDLLTKMQGIFGDRLDGEKARVLAASWVAGDFSAFPAIEVRDSAEINGAWGAFAQATGKIYLSRELVNAGDVGAIGSFVGRQSLRSLVSWL